MVIINENLCCIVIVIQAFILTVGVGNNHSKKSTVTNTVAVFANTNIVTISLVLSAYSMQKDTQEALQFKFDCMHIPLASFLEY